MQPAQLSDFQISHKNRKSEKKIAIDIDEHHPHYYHHG